jgi:hypothetical protein
VTAVRLTLADRRRVAGLRLAAQLVEPVGPTDPAAVVARLGAVQAQDYPAALWAIGLRAGGADRDLVVRAVEEARIVRTWPMRGTLHFVAAADLRWLVALLAPRAIRGAASRYRELGLDDGVVARAADVLTAALTGGRRLARPDAYRVLEEGGVSAEGQRGILLLSRLSMEGLLCCGPFEGRQPTFVLVQEWVPAAPAPQDPLAELATRYIAGHGPATAADLSWWSGLPLTASREAIEAAGARLRRFTLGEREWWVSTDHQVDDVRPAAGVHLLPGFDEYLLGYRDRSAVLPPEHRDAVAPGGNGVFRPMLVVNGQIAGTWTRRSTTKTTQVNLVPFGSSTQAVSASQQAAVRRALARYADFLGTPAELV